MEYFVSKDQRSYSFISIWIFDFGPEKLPGLLEKRTPGPKWPLVHLPLTVHLSGNTPLWLRDRVLQFELY